METQTKLTNYNLITSQMLPAFIFYLWGESLKLSENEVMFIEFMRGVHVNTSLSRGIHRVIGGMIITSL